MNFLFTFTCPWSIVSQVRHSRETLFHFVLNVDLELSHLTHGIVRLVKDLLPFLVDHLVNVKLNSIVSCRDCCHIKVDIFVELNLFYVVHVNHGEQVNPNTNAADH